MNKAKRLIRAKSKAKSRRNGTYKPTKYKLGKAYVAPVNTVIKIKEEANAQANAEVAV